MATQMDARGRVTIPPDVREALNFHPGDELVVTIEAGRAVLESRRDLVARLQGSWAPVVGRDLAQELIGERREAAAVESAEIERSRTT